MKKDFTFIKIVIAADVNNIVSGYTCKLAIFSPAFCLFSNFTL